MPLSNGGYGRHVQSFANRALDVVGALVALCLAWPLLLLAAVLIKLDSPGPVFFRQRRCGRGGRLFTMIKLRTMVADADRRQAGLHKVNEVDGPMFKVERDPRVTRLGVLLRKTCLDEVPQMINVLRGEMSLVGPRPLAPHEMSLVPAWRDLRLMVKPGVTGLWQLHGRERLAFASWIANDIEFVKHHSLAMNIRILFKTLRMVAGCWHRELARFIKPEFLRMRWRNRAPESDRTVTSDADRGARRSNGRRPSRAPLRQADDTFQGRSRAS